MSVERLVYLAIFVLLLLGLAALSAYAIYVYLQDNLILMLAGMSLSWGLILLALFLFFKKLGWKWWS